MSAKTLIFIPTYNEHENAPRMCEEIHKLGIDADVLFVDDNSPDGTGRALDDLKPRFPRLIVHHRTAKLGIGSAHVDGISWAYAQGYSTLVTLDCDFTHSPTDIPSMLAALETSDVIVGSRWVNAGSLPGWNLFRRFMTWAGHLLTKTMLGMTQDASGAFRAYRLDRLPCEVFKLVQSRGYSFFFESLFILIRNGFRIREIPIVLPARTYGSSKMDTSAALRSAGFVFELALANTRRPERFLLEPAHLEIDPSLADPQEWDNYWNEKADTAGSVFEFIAGIYRRAFIKPALEKAVRSAFPPRAEVLHAGCGSGQVDKDLHSHLRITAVDISPSALHLYARNNPGAAFKHASIFALPFANASFDGIYNLGVMEHFVPSEIHSIFQEFSRVIKPGGHLLLFWPMSCAPSVKVLGLAHFVLNKLLKRRATLHPAEVSLLNSKDDAARFLSEAGFTLESFHFGYRDLFTQAQIIASKPGAVSSTR